MEWTEGHILYVHTHINTLKVISKRKDDASNEARSLDNGKKKKKEKEKNCNIRI